MNGLTPSRAHPDNPGRRARRDIPAQKVSSMNTIHSRRCRIQFDFELVFANGGRVRGDGFRLSLCGDDISDAELAARVMRHLRLPGVRRARILGKQITGETDERNAAPAPNASRDNAPDLVDHGPRIEDGLITSLTWPRCSSVPAA
jgi:hypothetical protein